PSSSLFSCFFYGSAPPRDLHSFPTRRSSDLAGGPRLESDHPDLDADPRAAALVAEAAAILDLPGRDSVIRVRSELPPGVGLGSSDRKSTRLNSSHVEISYAVFCLKKKKIKMK